MDLIKAAENQFRIERVFPEFKAGDTITVHYKIVEGNKERIQQYRGECAGGNRHGEISLLENVGQYGGKIFR
jgi:large subunit ribosomal protein L19